MAADPTYPLLPIFALLSAALLLILLTTNFVRRSWNLGVSFLAFWLFWENLFYAINAIIWSDNGDIKLYALCDIATHVYVFTYIVKPACTLILTRRLYKIASLRSLIPENHRVRTVDMIIEWSLGLGLPTLVAGIFYYIVQFSRFQVIEGYGCCATEDVSGVSILLIEAPGLILPLISLLFYCPKIILVFYRHSRDTNEFLRANGSVSRGGYSRILILGCLDIFLTLPVGILQLVSSIRGVLRNSVLPWYWGWDATHSNWDPLSASWRDIEQSGPWPTFNLYFARWNPVVLALAIFALFGFSAESRATYTRVMYAILKLFGWTAPESKHDDRSGVHFGIRSLISTRTRTQQISSTSFPEMRGFDVSEDLEHGVRFVINSSEIKAIGAIVGSGPPNTETVTICRAEDGGISRDNERLKIEDSNESTPNAQTKDLLHFESS